MGGAWFERAKNIFHGPFQGASLPWCFAPADVGFELPSTELFTVNGPLRPSLLPIRLELFNGIRIIQSLDFGLTHSLKQNLLKQNLLKQSGLRMIDKAMAGECDQKVFM